VVRASWRRRFFPERHRARALTPVAGPDEVSPTTWPPRPPGTAAATRTCLRRLRASGPKYPDPASGGQGLRRLDPDTLGRAAAPSAPSVPSRTEGNQTGRGDLHDGKEYVRTHRANDLGRVQNPPTRLTGCLSNCLTTVTNSWDT
jgi:hypothetical protein